jgi:hypothetical protein
MVRRLPEAQDRAIPIAMSPGELNDDMRWCDLRGRAPYCDPTDVVAMREAAAWTRWEREREVWAAAHGVAVDDAVLDWVPGCDPGAI